jgi:RNA polymerase sigma-70 factor (ECF subfamily)
MFPDADMVQLRSQLLRFAKLQLRDPCAAEDAVSETLLAILERPDRFEGRSSLRTYATGILKFKIIDSMRRRRREVSVDDLGDADLAETIDQLFEADGHWQDPPAAWCQPERSLEQQQFFEVLQACVDKLPPRLGRVFMMREWLELEVEDICRELEISANNCGVMLYRARMSLRACLDLQWFGQTP